ncbi:hypothetical protein K431DRAFT_227481 [Polychaeton citri CBS 116435]|uniref:ferric-chelate reductase (NADPH) n=1 Tax=Polychaeton citri CBS 116435 TaxID=1314669 RepID=A0A9P4Q583_9PEZI|nr:hypothetical protein K431DRAFT_227481 [Polychaeton citri CBS 116435]
MDAENASQAATPWMGQFRYGRYLAYYWVVLLFVAMLWHLGSIWTNAQTSKPAVGSTSSMPSLTDRVQAGGRYLFYRRFDRRPGRLISIPQAGTLLLLLITIVYVLALTFTEYPYYREFFQWGSPPLAIRTGLMAFACLPIMVALPGKANVLTLLTGYGHEKLNIIHQWVAWISFTLSLIHTIPFFVASVQERGNGGFARVKLEFYRNNGGPMTEFSGVPPLAMHFGLCVFSIPAIRARFYKTFYWLHIGLAISYLGLLYWHAGNAGDSWAYLWATLAIWLTAWLVRLFWKNRSTNIHAQWFSGSRSVMTVHEGPLVRIEVDHPIDFTFRPGQHCFLRFPHLSFFDNHPFTIASAPFPTNQCDSEGARPRPRLLFLAKAESGFTKTLADQVSRSANTMIASAHVDGPYGSLPHAALERRYDSILLIAGGSGITVCLSWLLYLVFLPHPTRLRTITLVWSFRNAKSFQWAADELSSVAAATAATRKKGLEVKMIFHVTGLAKVDADSSSAASPVDDTIEVAAKKEKGGGPLLQRPHHCMKEFGENRLGRPNLKTVIAEAAVISGARTAVVASGTHEMNFEISNACAAAQKNVLAGRLPELALHVESFGW